VSGFLALLNSRVSMDTRVSDDLHIEQFICAQSNLVAHTICDHWTLEIHSSIKLRQVLSVSTHWISAMRYE
jgi:hypothetical protein